MARARRVQPRKQATQARAQATVEAILRATAHILVRDGYDHASTNRIAERAGVSIGSLYQYFPSKEALVGALLDRHIGEMRAVLTETSAAIADAPLPEAVRAFVGAMIRAHGVDPVLHRVLLEQTPRVGGLAKAQVIENDAMALARAYLGARKDIVPKNVDLAAFVTVHAIEALTHAAVLYHPELLENAAFVDELVALVVRYLTGRSPRSRTTRAGAPALAR